ncbi:hypothetical protein [Tateyamaria sp.]|uniref:hypothetical protein n=1 Tax=Tateyamaria sp. TaxID=1929288 RepID=UPI00329AFF86
MAFNTEGGNIKCPFSPVALRATGTIKGQSTLIPIVVIVGRDQQEFSAIYRPLLIRELPVGGQGTVGIAFLEPMR